MRHMRSSVINFKVQQLGYKQAQRKDNPNLIIIDFEILLLNYKAVRSFSPVYVSELVTLYVSECSFRSTVESSKGDFVSKSPLTPTAQASKIFPLRIFYNFVFGVLTSFSPRNGEFDR